jgi:hypothetical protein
MLILWTTFALAAPAPSTHLGVCDSGGVAYLGILEAQGLKRVTSDGTQAQLDTLLSLPWTVHGQAITLGPVRLSLLDADSQDNSWPLSEGIPPGMQILLAPCSERGAVYIDQAWTGVEALPGHQIQLLEPSPCDFVLDVDGAIHSLGTCKDEEGYLPPGHAALPPDHFGTLQLLQAGSQGLAIAPHKGPFSKGWLVVQLGAETRVQYIETENSWD